jgi:hypothetical protein
MFGVTGTITLGDGSGANGITISSPTGSGGLTTGTPPAQPPVTTVPKSPSSSGTPGRSERLPLPAKRWNSPDAAPPAGTPPPAGQNSPGGPSRSDNQLNAITVTARQIGERSTSGGIAGGSEEKQRLPIRIEAPGQGR